MKIHTTEQLSRAYEDASPSTQEMLFSSALENQVQKIGTMIAILTDGTKTLNNLTNLAILKLLDEKELAEELVDRLKIDSVVAQKITSDVFLQIVAPVRQTERGGGMTTYIEQNKKPQEASAKIPSTPNDALTHGTVVASPDHETVLSPQASLLATRESFETGFLTPQETPAIIREEPTAPVILPVVEPIPNLVPQNLSVSETEATSVVVLPPEPVKQSFAPNNEARSSFEEKMGQAFVKTSMDINAGSGTGSTARVDPYREPIG